MKTVHIAAIAVVALVALAGCNLPGGGPGGDGTATETQFGPETLSSSDIIESNQNALEEAGSFNVEAEGRYNTTSDNALVGNTTFSQNVAVDFATNRSHFTATYYASETSRYTNDSGTYVRTQTGNQTAYRVDEIPYNNSRVQPVDMISMSPDTLQKITFEKTGYTEHEGETVAIYEAQNSSEFARQFAETTSSSVEIDNANITVYRNQNNVVTHVYTEYEGTSNDAWFQLRTTRNVNQIGSTTVEAPSWVSTAIQNSSSR